MNESIPREAIRIGYEIEAEFSPYSVWLGTFGDNQTELTWKQWDELVSAATAFKEKHPDRENQE